ncbi:hypothetical protein [Paenibacillus sp. FSL R10-2736]|uniref:hypothetical protein n=1 Tax=Paenibacillus sp. FSL R10-2736 TaxID=2954692 RepID=UPI0030F7D5FB
MEGGTSIGYYGRVGGETGEWTSGRVGRRIRGQAGVWTSGQTDWQQGLPGWFCGWLSERT